MLYIQGQPLKVESCTKYLGLTTDSHLTWVDHVADLCKRMRPKVGLLSRVRHTLPFPQVFTIYISTVQTLIDYGLSIWGSCNISTRMQVQRLQNRCVRLLVNNFDHDIRSATLLKEVNLMDVGQRYKYFVSLLTFKSIKGIAPNYLSDRLTFMRDLHGHNTRNEHILQIPQSKSNAMQRSFTYVSASLWNALPEACHLAESVSTFKHELKSILNAQLLEQQLLNALYLF